MNPHLYARAVRFLPTLPFVLLALLSGCSPRAGEQLVARVGETPITLDDYENLYIKSSGSREAAAGSTQEEREKFLGLMTNFRLKLADAYSSGLDRKPEIQNEIRQYKGSLAASYLTDREVTSPGVRRLYQRRTEEIRSSHILLNLSPEASVEDSVNTYAKAADLIRQLKGGADFATLALEFSQDPSVKQNNGDLYYFTGGQMVPAFEDAAYALQPGEISPAPVRTQYGLHILKVVDRKPAPGDVQCSHIMIRFDRQDPTPEDTLAALAKIRAIQDTLRTTGDFAGLAERNSGDPGSASRGGDLGWFTRRRWIQSFDEVALTMKPGQVSDVVRTMYGYHLIKCTDAKPPKTFDEARQELAQIYQQVRFQEDYARYLGKLKKESGFALNDSVLALFFAALDSNSSTRDTSWANDLSLDLRALPLYRFGQRSVTVDSAVALMKNRPDMASAPLRPATLRPLIDKVGEQLIYEVKAETIERDYPEFASIMKEYSEGILLYQIEQDRVWSRVSVSDSALGVYYEKNRDKFQFPDRVDISILHPVNDSVAAAFGRQIAAGSSLEEIARADSLRMKTPASYPVHFKGTAFALTPAAKKLLASAAQALNRDASVRLTVAAYSDTAARAKKRSEKLMQQRIGAVQTYLTRTLGISPERIVTQTRIAPGTLAATDKSELLGRVEVDLSGRRAAVIGRIENTVLPVDSDERTAHADSLAPGMTSGPFHYQGAVYLIRLNKREPARQKTFEEAGTEVSSTFQEYESKRLEQNWLQDLRTSHPVVEYREVLKNAFAPAP